MKEEIVDLTGQFNATVAKGSKFKIVFRAGGIGQEAWHAEITSGKATPVSDNINKLGANEKIYTADEAGTIVIEATGISRLTQQPISANHKHTYTIKVK